MAATHDKSDPEGPSLYLHGFDDSEQQRLIAQSEYWRSTLIPLGLEYQVGDHVLEIGCAAGATLAVLCNQFPGIIPAGVDLEPRQIAYAERHLKESGFNADLRVGDAAELPWASETFDHVYIMWLLEHLSDAAPVLREAFRVIKPGGTIAVTETDYTRFVVRPQDDDFEALVEAQRVFFEQHGNATAGPELASLLDAAGFTAVKSEIVGFQFATNDRDRLRQHTEYIAGFLEPAIAMLTPLGYDREQLERGVHHLRKIHSHPDGFMSNDVYRAQASRP